MFPCFIDRDILTDPFWLLGRKNYWYSLPQPN
jgi:hypothetical protein